MIRQVFKFNGYINQWNNSLVYRFSTSLFLKLQKLGVSKNFIEQAESNKTISNHLEDLYNKYNDNLVSDKKKANLIISLTSKLTPTLEAQKYQLAQYIVNEQISSNADLEKALVFVKDQAKKNAQLNWQSFEEALGIGRKIDESQILNDILTQLKEISNINKEQLLSNKKYASSHMRTVRDNLKQYESKLIFQYFDKAIEIFVNEDYNQQEQQEDTDGVIHSKDNPTIFIKEDSQTHIWDKIAQLKGRDLCYENNSQPAYQRHLKERAGIQYILRFPPEPNGYLHLGHAKALRTNFYSAEQLGGICYLRYDDTNPEKEKLDYIESIKDNVLWFGFKPYKITYSSDYFQQIYECAIKLIEKKLAYICELSQEEMAELRQNKEPSPYRERSIEDNLRMFEEMKQGKYKENQVCLRMKIDYEHANPTMRDPVMYRVKHHAHPKTGDEWCIYPMYDFTHCLCDSFENITHSLCTLEFEIRRDLYYWILDALDLYKPVVWEYSRLNVSNTVLSKRKLLQLINNKIVEGWDDPRLLTINALRRRGVRPEAINQFVDLVNVARRGNENIIDQKLLDYCIRQDLEDISPRTMAVLDPIRLEIENFDDFQIKSIQVPLFPKDSSKGSREIALSSVLMVDSSDVRESGSNVSGDSSLKANSKKVDKNTFIGLYPGSVITLKYFGVIQVLSVNLKEKLVKCKLISIEEKDRRETVGQVHWINPSQAVQCQVKVYHELFKVADPNQFDNILDAVNPNSLETFSSSLIHQDLFNQFNQYNTFQFERQGYFALDKTSNIQQKHLIFNRTVNLKDRVNRAHL